MIAFFVKLTRQRMRALGFDIHLAYDAHSSDGRRQDPPDLILLDIGMPGRLPPFFVTVA
jgi:CheY-like chemotaxis protein